MLSNSLQNMPPTQYCEKKKFAVNASCLKHKIQQNISVATAIPKAY